MNLKRHIQTYTDTFPIRLCTNLLKIDSIHYRQSNEQWRIKSEGVFQFWFHFFYFIFILEILFPCSLRSSCLTQWGRVTHICVSKLTIIGSDNGLSPDRRQAIIWTNAGLLLIRPLGTNLSEIVIEILTFSFKKMRLKLSSAKRRPFCLGLNVLSFIVFHQEPMTEEHATQPALNR